MSKLAKALTAAAGNAGESLYVEDVFSTYLYTGNGSTQTITNGIDLSGEGGLTWIKGRDTAYDHRLFDTDRGAGKMLSSNNTGAEQTLTEQLEAFNSDGFQVGNNLGINGSGSKYASWTFRKAEKFFDVVTFTSASSGISTVAHNLGSVPACIIVKTTASATGWVVYHTGTDPTSPQDKILRLDLTNAASTSSGYFGSTGPTDSEFQVNINNNEPCVAYLFASDAGGFGDDGSENIIKCGSYTADGSGNVSIDLGFEPQFVISKRTDSTGSWEIADSMRGFYADGGANSINLFANLSNAEGSNTLKITSTGFTDNNAALPNSSHIYIAIRRPMKTPESGTEVFAMDTAGGTSPTPPTYNSGFPVDFFFNKGTGGTDGYAGSRLQGAEYLTLNSTAAATSSSTYEYDFMDGARSYNWTNSSWYAWMFKRATGFFDVVAYTSTTSAINHNLGVSPELVIYKSRTTGTWFTMVATDGFGELNSSGAWGGAGNGSGLGPNLANATATTITGAGNLYGSGVSMVTYLFATLAGVSKIGSYTGTGSNVDLDCGFSAGARFILIKRTDSTGDWYVWDSVRGIVAGNDPYLLLNSTAAEVTSTDYIDPLASGFTVTSTAPAALNASGGNYIFLAIA